MRHVAVLILVTVLSCSASEGMNTKLLTGIQPKPAFVNTDIEWIQATLNNWSFTCEKELSIGLKQPPWIIFYDSSSAWHVNPEEKMLPAFEKTAYTITYNKKEYRLVRVLHTTMVWVPDRDALPLSALPLATMPYANNTKVFFIAPLPSSFHKLVPPDQTVYVDFLFMGSNIHELTHTRQLPFVLKQLVKIHDEGSHKILDDNTVEKQFSGNDRYRQLFSDESMHLWNAVFTTSEDSCIAGIERAFNVRATRLKEFFSDDRGLAQADEIFLSLEGSAMWAQYRTMLINTPNPDERELLSWLRKQGPAWSQDRGLVLFLLIDRFSPEWKTRFFEQPVPPANEYLRDVLASRKR